MARDKGVKSGTKATDVLGDDVSRGIPERGSRAMASREENRESRENADADRHDDGLELSPQDRAQMLRDEALGSSLPDPPKIAGVHWFWATTMKSAKPPLSWYIKLGYRVVRSDDKRLQGWIDTTRTRSGGEYDGCVSINEMILMWCTTDVYHQIMRVIHHDRPMEEGTRLKETHEAIAHEMGTDRTGKQLVTQEGDDISLLDRPRGLNHVAPGSKKQFE